MKVARRSFLLGTLAAPVFAKAALTADPDPLSSSETIRLWPGAAPGSAGVSVKEEATPPAVATALRSRNLKGVAHPRLIVHRPVRPNGAAMMIMPGGGYRVLSIDKEGFDVAAWLAGHGITAFVLLYRLPGEGWQNRSQVPLADAQRALRLIRSNASRFGIDPQRIGAMGFSAGGHLCADLATRFAAAVYRPLDAADRASARPSVAAPIYPVISMSAPLAHMGSRASLLGADADAAMEIAHSPDRNVTPETPPCFIAHAEDDRTVPVENALILRKALKQHGIPVETHLFTEGGHGFALRAPPRTAAHLWPDLFLRWATSRGFI